MHSPLEYKQLTPVSDALAAKKARFDQLLRENFASRKRFVVVCGPCSADDPQAMEEYLLRLKQVADECDKLLVVARIYTAKPHSNGVGYKGTAFQLRTGDLVDLDEGITRCRRMMRRCLEIGLPVADELLYPSLYESLNDLVSYWFVGARSSEDSLHRDIASGLDVCCGVKNSTDGSVEKAIDSLYAISNPCVFPHMGWQFSTSGCKYAHIVLRGGVTNGRYTPNLDAESVSVAKKSLCELGLNDFVMADLNHANSGKCADNQLKNARLALQNGVDGIMVESYLHAGGGSAEFGTSQTDDCLDFPSTAKLLRELNDKLS